MCEDGCGKNKAILVSPNDYSPLAGGGDALDVFEKGAAAGTEGGGAPGLPAFLPLLVRNQEVNGASLRPRIDADGVTVLFCFVFS